MLVAVRANFQDNIDVEEFEIGSGQDEATREKFKVPEDMSLEDFWAEQMELEDPEPESVAGKEPTHQMIEGII
jgi:hypothetical protein